MDCLFTIFVWWVAFWLVGWSRWLFGSIVLAKVRGIGLAETKMKKWKKDRLVSFQFSFMGSGQGVQHSEIPSSTASETENYTEGAITVILLTDRFGQPWGWCSCPHFWWPTVKRYFCSSRGHSAFLGNLTFEEECQHNILRRFTLANVVL